MTSVPRVVVRDGGKLTEIRELLAELGIEFAESTWDSPGTLPSHLLITSGPWAVETLKQLASEGAHHHFLHFVVIDHASRSLRGLLQREGCDMVARRPVHPTVLRLLIQRALYGGSEKRTADRVAIGEKVKIKSGILARSATLAELSMRGCGLVVRQVLDEGTPVSIVIPKLLTKGTALTMTGRVVGVQRDLEIEEGAHGTAVVFDGMSQKQARTIRDIMRAKALGKTGQLPEAPGTPTAGSASLGDAEVVPYPTGERQHRRAQYDNPVLARGEATTHSLIGCDLSLGGMRVAPDADLETGATLQLAIYGDAGVPPVVVRATVKRSDPQSGLGLQFEQLEEPARTRLSEIVAGLKELDLESRAKLTGTVVSRVIDRSDAEESS